MSTNTADYMREYMQRYRAAGKGKQSKRSVDLQRPFVGVDGEGGNLANGYHAYNLLSIGAQTLFPQGKNARLSTVECLDLITRQDPNAIYVGYFFDYDVTKMLEDLPWDKLDRLVNRSKRTGINNAVFPVDFAHFQLDYLPRKEFKARRKLSDGRWGPWIVISDVGTFFQMSFLRAIQTWDIGTPEEHAIIEAGKRQRANFAEVNREEILLYNQLEIRLLQDLMGKFREACRQAGYLPKRWQGPGLLAETMLRAHGVRKTADVPLLQSSEHTGLLTFARNAYYGGRFEVASVGPVHGPVYQHDINSAYPYAMQFLPCLHHGRWVLQTSQRIEGYDVPTGKVGERYALQYGSFTRGKEVAPSLWYGLPVRSKSGTIVFPESGRGWYWSFEIQSAKHQTFLAEETWEYTRTCKCRPLAFVADIYTERKKLGKDGPGLILKLGMNSLYGKMVQSIGSPKYSNPIWGSFITAYTRMMIQDVIHDSFLCEKGLGCGKDVVMVATDSLAVTVDRSDSIGVSDLLGGWSTELHPQGMFVVQPGVYFGTSGKPTKTRGFTRTVVDHYQSEFRRAFDAMVTSRDLSLGSVALPVQIFAGIRYALQRRNLTFLGQWLDYGTETAAGKALSFDWTSKRQHIAIDPTADRPWITTLPHTGSVDAETIPYSKNIGGLMDAEVERLAFADLPDWSPMGDTYD